MIPHEVTDHHVNGLPVQLHVGIASLSTSGCAHGHQDSDDHDKSRQVAEHGWLSGKKGFQSAQIRIGLMRSHGRTAPYLCWPIHANHSREHTNACHERLCDSALRGDVYRLMERRCIRGQRQENFDGTKKSVHICVQSEAAATSSDSHEVRKRSRKHAILRDAANHRSPLQTILVGDKGLEPLTPSV